MSTGKQRVINHLFNAAGKGYKPDASERTLLEQFIYAICREGATRAAADEAYQTLKQQFFDWNEVRVSMMREVADVLAGHVCDPEVRAQRIIDFLQELFETTFSFDMDPIAKKGLKPALKQLARFKAASDFALAWITVHGLGGHAVPLDAENLRVLRRLAVLEDGKDDLEALRATLEHLVPKAKAIQLLDLVSNVADEWCFATDPNCPRCPMLSVCATGQEVKAAVATTSKRSR